MKSIPAWTKLTVISDAAVDERIMAVTRAPVSSEVKRLVVSESRMAEAVACQLLQAFAHEFGAVHQQAEASQKF